MMKFTVTCANTTRMEYAGEPAKAVAQFQNELDSDPTCVTVHLQSTALDKLGWIAAGKKYEVVIRQITE